MRTDRPSTNGKAIGFLSRIRLLGGMGTWGGAIVFFEKGDRLFWGGAIGFLGEGRSAFGGGAIVRWEVCKDAIVPVG